MRTKQEIEIDLEAVAERKLEIDLGQQPPNPHIDAEFAALLAELETVERHDAATILSVSNNFQMDVWSLLVYSDLDGDGILEAVTIERFKDPRELAETVEAFERFGDVIFTVYCFNVWFFGYVELIV